MNPKLEQQLMSKFPFMEISCECDDGWYHVIDRLCAKIEWDLICYDNPDFTVLQVKEKYGLLCFYTSSIPLESKIFDYISEAEEESTQTCEHCGSTNNVSLYGNYWVMRRCDKCETKM
jgi:hypothetical protein